MVRDIGMMVRLILIEVIMKGMNDVMFMVVIDICFVINVLNRMMM